MPHPRLTCQVTWSLEDRKKPLAPILQEAGVQDDQPPPIDPLRIWGVAQWCFCEAHVQVIRQKSIRANKPFSGSAFALAPLGSNALN
jgi:hypothetical protein